MRKNGFTLIELLAVIVILAIIAIIATPIVLNIINNARTSSNERSGELYVKAVENAIMKKQMNGTDVVEDGEYTVQSDGSICIVSNNVCTDGTTISVDVDGDIPEVGSTLTIDTKGVVVSYNLVVSGTEITKGTPNGGSTTTKVYTNGEAVYFNVTTGEKCTESDAVSTTGTKAGCMKFYAFNDEGEDADTINLILDHNTTTTVAWVNEEDFISAGGAQSDWDNFLRNHKGPLTILSQLKTDTENWNGVETPDSYTNTSNGYTVYYTNYGGKARLITANELAEITGNTTWDESDESADVYYCGSEYAWLFDYTNNCINFGCNIADSSTEGYWTVSALPSDDSKDNGSAWIVSSEVSVDAGDVTDSDYFGVRPVITVLKSKLN